MENPELANTSSKLDKKKKSKLYSDKHGGSSDQESFLHVDTDVKPRRSFWKNLFRKQPKKSEVPEMVTDQKAAVITSRLNAIFEEPKTPEEKEHVVEEIEDIKKTLKKMSPIPDTPPSVLLPGITPPAADPVSVLKDETLLEYLSDVSSSSDTSVSSLHGITDVPDVLDVLDVPDVPDIENRDSLDAFIAKLTPTESGDPKDPKKATEQRENSLGRDGYSFEYSETSELSTTEDENKDNKVLTFDEKVEQKDADSNIVVRDLNPGNDVHEPTEEPTVQQHEKEETEEIEKTDETEETEKPGADRTEIVTKDGIVLVLPTSKIPVAIPVSYDQQQTKRFTEDILTTSGQTQTTKTEVPKQWSASGSGSLSGSVDSLLEEAEIWNQKLNEFSCSSTTTKSVLPTAVDVQSLDETEAGYREYRLDDFFKMIFRQTTDEQLLNYSVAYDPVFANFNVQCRQPSNHESPYNSLASDKQKVVRKRKMMSLLHDKTKMAEYLKEIEQQEEEIIKKQQNNCSTPLNSPNKQESSTLAQPHRSISAGNDAKVERDDKNVLFVLENTKQKLQKYLERNNSVDPKVNSLYPDNYLEIYNMAGNKPAVPTVAKSDENIPIATDLPSVSHKMRQFQNIGEEISSIFQELLINISELKDTCIMNGAEFEAQSEPLIVMTPMEASADEVVQPLLEELLERVFQTVETETNDSLVGRFSPAQSFMKEFGEIHDFPATVNISTAGTSHLILPCISLERSEGLLTALKDEISEYSPCRVLNNETNENSLIDLSPQKTNSDLIPRNLIDLMGNPEIGSQTDPPLSDQLSDRLSDAPLLSDPLSDQQNDAQLLSDPLSDAHVLSDQLNDAHLLNDPLSYPLSYPLSDQQNDAPLLSDAPVLSDQLNDAPLLNDPLSDRLSDQQNDAPLLSDPLSDAPVLSDQLNEAPLLDDPLNDTAPLSDRLSDQQNDAPLLSDPLSDTPRLSDQLSDRLRQQAAENLVQSIEQTLDRSKKFGPYHEKKPGESLDSTKFPQKKNELYKNFRSTDVPEMTDSLQHIFFGTDNSGEIIESEFNLVEENVPRPSTSKNASSPSENNSLNTSLLQLPSVPSTDLFSREKNSKNSLKDDSNLETLVDNRFSGLTGASSVQEDIPLDLVTLTRDASGSGSPYQLQNEKESFQLERKPPETNLVQDIDENLLNKKNFDKSIEANLKTIQESMVKINKTNAKTVEMLSSSAFSTPEGSLSILSTITENILETTSRVSKSDDRYPQFIAREANSTNLAEQKNPNRSP